MLSPFGQQFKDNGFQMGNDRDAPIFQQAAYWPVTFPHYADLASGKQQQGARAMDPIAPEVRRGRYNAPMVSTGAALDFHTGGTLAKNYSVLCSAFFG